MSRDVDLAEEFERRARAGDGQYAIALSLYLVAKALDRHGVGNLSTDGGLKMVADSLVLVAKAIRAGPGP